MGKLRRRLLPQAAEVQTFVQSNPHLGFTLILQLTGVNGSQQFDKLTKTKTIESILTSMDTKGIKNYIEYLLAQVNHPEITDKYVTIERFFTNSFNTRQRGHSNNQHAAIVDR